MGLQWFLDHVSLPLRSPPTHCNSVVSAVKNRAVETETEQRDKRFHTSSLRAACMCEELHKSCYKRGGIQTGVCDVECNTVSPKYTVYSHIYISKNVYNIIELSCILLTSIYLYIVVSCFVLYVHIYLIPTTY